MRFLSCAVALLAAIFFAAGCAFDGTPQLIQVLDYAPREVEVGDRLELTGAGFPQGRPAHVTFRGALHRPGEKPTPGAEIAAEGNVTSPQHIEVALDDTLASLFCGAGDRALHTTFEGEVDVAFSVASPKDPPIEGTLRRVSIDVRPPAARAETFAARSAEGAQALAFLGIHVKDDADAAPQAGGVVVAGVDAGSRAEEAGIAPGDVLVRFDGVRVANAGDAIPAPGDRSVTVALRRGEDPRERTRTVSIEGFRPAAPTDLLASAVILVVALAVVLLFAAPGWGGLGWVERRIAARVLEVGARRPASALVALMAFARDFAGGLAIVRAAPYVVFALATATFVALPFGQYIVGAEADCGVLFLLAFTAFVLISVVTGGWSARHAWTPARAAVALFDAVSTELPAAIAVLSVVVTAGTLRVQEIIRAQGGWPWDWYALKSPVTVALFFLFFSTALVDEARGPRDLVEADLGKPPRATPSPRATFFFFAEQGKTFVLCALAAAIFLGGWQLPGVAPAQQESQRALEVAGALLFAVKAWALVLAVAWARWALPRLPARIMTKVAWKYLVPSALSCLLLSLAWVAWSPGRGAQRMMSVAIAGVAALGLAYVVHRVRYGVRASRVALNPFL